MLTITMIDEAKKKLTDILEDEDEDARVRIREFKTGTPCQKKISLGLGIDELEDDDLEGEIDSIPFVISEDLAEKYGKVFSISICNETKIPIVTAEQK